MLRERHGFAADDVAEIVVTVPPLTGQLIRAPTCQTRCRITPRLCTAFVVAKVLQHGQLDLSHYRGNELANPRTHALAANMRVQMDSNPDPNALVPQHLVVRLRDGRELHWACPFDAGLGRATADPRTAFGEIPPLLRVCWPAVARRRS